ncbi:MAG TPA: TOBE domain-containing protein [Coriobacteriia bacterium]|nr:TOBE domain-containing protein [Coriobacteriia bacterium]
MKITSRNQLPGTIVSVTRGPVSAMVKIKVAEGLTISATVTSEAVDELGLKEGMSAVALFKASSVMLALEE